MNNLKELLILKDRSMKSVFSKNVADLSTYLFISLLLLISSLAFGLYEPSILHYDGNNRLVYHSDEEGNRIMDFSYAGYKNGEAALPNVAVVHTISPVAGDNTAHLQAAINYVESLPLNGNGHRGALLLNPGTYPVSQTIYINSSGVVLRGSGKGSNPAVDTIIYGTGTDRRSVLIVGTNTINKWGNQVSGTQQDIISEFLPAGSRTFQVADASVYDVGDNVIIKHIATDEWLSEVNYGNVDGDALWNTETDTIDMVFNRYITRIEGNTIEVDVPIYHDLDRSLVQSYIYVYTRSSIITECGVENIRVDIETASPTDNDHPEAGIKFVGVEDSWVQDATTLHFAESGIWLNQASRVTVLNSRAIDPHSVIEAGRRYNFYLGVASNNVLIKGCHGSYGRHTFVSNGSASVAGAVFTQCTSTYDYASSESHRRWGAAILWDNITFSSTNTYLVLGLYNRGSWGTGHGWTGTNFVAWNVSAPNDQIVVQKPPIGQNYGIGCNATVNNQGPWVHPVGYIEGTGQDMLITSLYEAQLAERLTYGVGPDAPGKLEPLHYQFTDETKYVTLRWIDIALDETNYLLERSSDGGNTFGVIDILAANTESYTDTDILQDNYWYRLRAINATGFSAYSNLLYVDLLVRLRPDGPTIQAEDYTSISGCTFDITQKGFTSRGYVDMGNAGSWFELDNVEFATDMACTLVFHYALDSGARPCEITVNGNVAGSVSFPATGGWATWSTDTIDVKLDAGMNTIRVTANPGAGPNIDKIEIVPGAGVADFICDGIVDGYDLSYMAGAWLTDDYMADIAQPEDGLVNLADLSVVSLQWLWDTGLPDTTPPTPETASFDFGPVASGGSSITMTATTGYDNSGTVEYYFDETSGNPGGTDSGWTTSSTYTDSGLSATTTYTYTVTMRDDSGNEGTTSAAASATTWAATTTSILWNATGGGTADWSDSANWTGTAAGRPNGNFKCAIKGDGQAEAIVDTTSVFQQLVVGDNGNDVGAFLRVVDGGALRPMTTSWSGVGYNRGAVMTVEAGGYFETQNHLLFGRFGTSACELNVDGGHVVVGTHIDSGEAGGTITVGRGGLLEIGTTINITDTAVLHIDVRDGTITFNGDVTATVDTWITNGILKAYNGASTVNVEYSGGKTWITAVPVEPAPVGASARGDNPPDETADKAFDSNIGTKWLDFSPTGSWIQWRYAGDATAIVTQYAITSANDTPARDPMDWEFLGSNDEGFTWDLLDSRTGITFTDRFQKRIFTISNNDGYNVYRLQITAVADVGTANSVQLAELELLETVFTGQEPVAHLELDETAGSVASDSSLYGHDGVLMNMDDSDWVPGRTGNGLDFDGVNDYVAVDNICTWMAEGDVTVSAWVKAGALNPNMQFMIGINASNGDNRLLLGTQAGSTVLTLFDGAFHDTTATVIDNTWHHIAYVLEDSSDTITVYVDGSEVLSFASTASIAATDLLSLGQKYSGTTPNYFYSGLLDDVMVYNRALSETEIATLAQ